MPTRRAKSFMTLVYAALKPVSCVPPSVVGMLFTYENKFSVYASVCWNANSMEMPSRSPLSMIGSSYSVLRASLIYFTKSIMPPSYLYSNAR